MTEIRRASQWEIRLSRSFGFLHLRSLRDRIVAFAVFAALVPSVATALLAYSQNRRALDTRITEELRTSGTQGAREVGLWYQQRLFDIKVFASSYEVTENVTRRDAGPRVRAYLGSVMGRVEHLAELVVVDQQGRVLAAAPDTAAPVALPEGWLTDIRAGRDVAGFAAESGHEGSITLAVPIFRQGGGSVVAALAARLQPAGLAAQLAPLAPSLGALPLLAANGTVILRAANDTALASAGPLPPEQMDALRADTAVVTFVNGRGNPAVGTLRTVSALPWVTLAEISQEQAFAHAQELLTLVGLRNIERKGNPWGFDSARRMWWTKDLGVREVRPGEQVDLLFWVGCYASYDDRNIEGATRWVRILQKAGLDFGVLGNAEWCCGIDLRRMGHEYLYQLTVQKNVEQLQQVKFKKMVTTCPHCFNTLKNEYPQFGVQWEVLHYTSLLDELIDEGKVSFHPKDGQTRITFHDSCYLGRYNDGYDPPRRI